MFYFAAFIYLFCHLLAYIDARIKACWANLTGNVAVLALG